MGRKKIQKSVDIVIYTVCWDQIGIYKNENIVIFVQPADFPVAPEDVCMIHRA